MKVEGRVLLNFAVFYGAWFACVLGAAHHRPWLGTLTVIAAVLLHLWLSAAPRAELTLLLIATALGTVWDSALVALHLTQYAEGNFAPGIAPHWIIALWTLFATTLNVSLDWLKKSFWVAAVFGGVGGALSFYAGYRMGAVQMPDVRAGLAAQGIGWAIIMPLLCVLAARFNGARAKRPLQQETPA